MLRLVKANGSMSCRALLCGAINGKFEAFEKRLKTVREKAGPFAAVFIVGQLFEDGSPSAACPETTINAIERLIQLDIPVYFILDEGATAIPKKACSCAPLCWECRCAFHERQQPEY